MKMKSRKKKIKGKKIILTRKLFNQFYYYYNMFFFFVIQVYTVELEVLAWKLNDITTIISCSDALTSSSERELPSYTSYPFILNTYTIFITPISTKQFHFTLTSHACFPLYFTWVFNLSCLFFFPQTKKN